jgi:hypothetical protein
MANVLELNYGSAAELNSLTTPGGLDYVLAFDTSANAYRGFDGTIAGGRYLEFGRLPMIQAGAGYSYQQADRNKLVVRSNSGMAMADTLPTPGSVYATWSVTISNIDVSAAITLTPASGLIDGLASVPIAAGVTITYVTDGTNYYRATTRVAATTGALVYQGTWNASSNSPTLASGTGTRGYYYVVATAGTISIDGVATWNVGDWLVFDGSKWDKVDGVASEVLSINGRTGAVSILSADVTGALGYTPANLVSPSFTGTPTAPTASTSTNSTQLATTAFVLGQASNVTPSMAGTAAIGSSLLYARADHVHATDTTRLGAANNLSDLANVVTARTNLGAGAASGLATLDSSGRLTTSQIPVSLVGAVVYQGTWNASTNSPTLSSGTGTKGNYYVVATAGTTTLDGVSTWNIGDWAIFDGTKWDKVDGVASEVLSFNGRVGAVSLTSGDVTGALGYTPLSLGGGTMSGTIAMNGNVITNAGTIGIGTASPTSSVHVNGNIGSGPPVIGGGALFLQDTSDIGGSGGSIVFGGNPNTALCFAGIKGSLVNGSGQTTGGVNFYTRVNMTDSGLTQQLSIGSSGNIGVGPSATKIADSSGNLYCAGFYTTSIGRVTGAGTTQATAAATPYMLNLIGAGAANSGFVLPTAASQPITKYYNSSGNTIQIYPPSGVSIYGLAVNVPYALPQGYILDCFAAPDGNWVAGKYQ